MVIEDVDGADFLKSATTWLDSLASGSGADGSGNGIVDAADLGVWEKHYGPDDGIEPLGDGDDDGNGRTDDLISCSWQHGSECHVWPWRWGLKRIRRYPDLLIWQADFGAVADSSIASPSSAATIQRLRCRFLRTKATRRKRNQRSGTSHRRSAKIAPLTFPPGEVIGENPKTSFGAGR